MILELSIQNFLSFKDKVTFSFDATSDNTLEDYYVVTQDDGTRILKMAMVYGANASGKSNLIEAFDFLTFFLFNIPEGKNEKTDFIPFLFDKTKNEPGSFELIFYINGIKYKYELLIDHNTVYSEVLLFYPGPQPALVFKRIHDKSNNTSIVEFGSKIKISQQANESIQLKTLKNQSVFAAYSQVNVSIPELDKAVDWFSNKFINSIDPYDNLTRFSDQLISNNDKIKKHALDFILKADFNISDILFKDEIKKVPESFLKMIEDAPVPEEEKAKVKKEKAIHIQKTIFKHKIIKDDKEEFYSLPEERQSKGTIRYYGLSGPFYDLIEEDAFLPIDEIGSSLHPLLVIHFIKEFLKKSKKAQLIFTTHNLSLLMEKDILRKDAVWFTEKALDGSTSLFSLSDFNFRKELSFYNAYKQGKFGAIPVLED